MKRFPRQAFFDGGAEFFLTLSIIDIIGRYHIAISIKELLMREIDLAFTKLHILYHAAKEEVYGVGLVEELGRHGYKLSFGTLYPTLAKMVRMELLSLETRIVNHKQRKYYRITPAGLKELEKVKAKIKELYEEVIEDK
jgi:PadR family transcriptional regulator PadR